MASGASVKHFKQILESDKKSKVDADKNSNTAANEKKAVKNFQQFLQFNRMDPNFFNYTEQEAQ